MVAVALGLGAALCWGLADFLGGIRTRALTLAFVLLVSQLTGFAASALVVGVAGLDLPAFSEIAAAMAAGVCQLVGIAALYLALARGTMSVISPISASGAAMIPLIVGIATGERPASLQVAGMAAAFVGVILASRSPESGSGASPRQALGLAALAALGFGGFFVAMDASVESAGPFWALLSARATAATVLVAALLCLRPRLGSDRSALPSLALIGLLDVAANASFALGADTGLLSVVSVLASLYPVATVLLARVMLGERLIRVQAMGVVVALAGVALIATG